MTIFQKIIDREIDAKIVYEDDHTLAFLDLSQATPGHTLVIPKKATESMVTADTQTLSDVSIAVQKVSKQLMEALGVEGVNILSNVNEISGQTVFHYHVHIIPRYNKDEMTLKFDNHDQSIEEIYQRIVSKQ